MTDGSQFIDIIFFAMVALFFGLRLRNVLGCRTGNERSITKVNRSQGTIDDPEKLTSYNNIDEVANESVIQTNLDNFNYVPEGFLHGAKVAFERIVSAFAGNDRETLKPLLSDEVLKIFCNAIDIRAQAGEICQSKLISIVSADIEDSKIDDRKIIISVKFVSNQMILIKNAEGKIIEGDPSKSVQIIDLWRFIHDAQSTDPNWLLVATRRLE
ncbi:MAG: Tim44/TimA family putative adaptor protein [Rhodospirillaceae bacterium]|jgi:predicted lipid-binding transport protein (Tim44 family)|nr:Tim44/TimA family putative adaptor protein [Rhodospirillaceae bacterium]